MEIDVNSGFSILDVQNGQCYMARTEEAPHDLLTLAWEGRMVIADWVERSAEPQLTVLAQALGSKLLVPEVWREVLPQAGILISAAISGGTLRERLQEASQEAPGRCWLRLEPVRLRFPLPCPTGCGEMLTAAQLDAVLSGTKTFFTEALCCRYAYDLSDGAAMVLYDTQETLSKKMALAKETGFVGAVTF